MLFLRLVLLQRRLNPAKHQISKDFRTGGVGLQWAENQLGREHGEFREAFGTVLHAMGTGLLLCAEAHS